MAPRNFMEMLRAQWDKGNFVCVGLDSEYERIPIKSPSKATTVISFNRAIIDATLNLVCAYKPNIAFYEALGPDGWYALYETISFIHKVSTVPVILDAKRGDIGNTNDGYVRMAFEQLQADAITVSPYMGYESLQPFLDQGNKGIFVLCRTSNPGAGEFQDLNVSYQPEINPEYRHNLPLYQYVARRVSTAWNANGNCGLVVGSTCSQELQQVRHVVGDMPILIPGIGAQGGDITATVAAGKDSRGQGMIINSSRGIIFAKNPREELLKLHKEINKHRGGAA